MLVGEGWVNSSKDEQKNGIKGGIFVIQLR